MVLQLAFVMGDIHSIIVLLLFPQEHWYVHEKENNEMSEFNLLSVTPAEQVEEAGETWQLPTFNRYKHVFMQIDTDRGVTLSVDFNGTPVTLSFVPGQGCTSECIDIKVHHPWGNHSNVNGKSIPNQKVIMFRQSSPYVLKGDLLTVLCSREHLRSYEDGE